MMNEKFPELLEFAPYKAAIAILERAEAAKAEADKALADLLAGIPTVEPVKNRAASWLAGKKPKAPEKSEVTAEQIAAAEDHAAVLSEAVEQARRIVNEQRAAAAKELLERKRGEYKQLVEQVGDALQGVLDADEAERAAFNFSARLANDAAVKNPIHQRQFDQAFIGSIRHKMRERHTNLVRWDGAA